MPGYKKVLDENERMTYDKALTQQDQENIDKYAQKMFGLKGKATSREANAKTKLHPKKSSTVAITDINRGELEKLPNPISEENDEELPLNISTDHECPPD